MLMHTLQLGSLGRGCTKPVIKQPLALPGEDIRLGCQLPTKPKP